MCKKLILVLAAFVLTVAAAGADNLAGVLSAADDFVDAAGSSTFIDPLANDAVYGLRQLDPLSFTITALPQHGEIMVDAGAGGVQAGYFRLAPGADYARYTICTTDAACDTATIWFLEGSAGPLVSAHADRLNHVELCAASLSGEVYVFVPDLFPEDVIRSVRFLLNGEPFGYERFAPYDLAGGSETLAEPLDTRHFADGTLRVTTEIKFAESAGGRLARLETEASVANAPLLAFSYAPDRSGAGILEGGTFGGDVYVFLGILPLNPGIGPVPWSAEGVTSVRFLIDGQLVATERQAPYDLGGGSVGEARPFHMSALIPGQHTLRAIVRFASGRQIESTAPFEALD